MDILEMEMEAFWDHIHSLSDEDIHVLMQEMKALVQEGPEGAHLKRILKQKSMNHGMALLGKGMVVTGCVVTGSLMTVPAVVMAGVTTLGGVHLIKHLIEFQKTRAPVFYEQVVNKYEILQVQSKPRRMS